MQQRQNHFYYHGNQQYSIIALTDGVGATTERYAYTAYGEPTVLDDAGTVLAGSNSRYTYTGREWDSEIGLYHYRARMYDPVAGRFISRGPIGYLDETSSHQCSFAAPGMDPTGNCSCYAACCSVGSIIKQGKIKATGHCFPSGATGSIKKTLLLNGARQRNKPQAKCTDDQAIYDIFRDGKNTPHDELPPDYPVAVPDREGGIEEIPYKPRKRKP